MGRVKTKSEFQALTIRLDRNVYDKLDKYCSDSGQSKTVAIHRALEQYIDSYYEMQEKLKELTE